MYAHSMTNVSRRLPRSWTVSAFRTPATGGESDKRAATGMTKASAASDCTIIKSIREISQYHRGPRDVLQWVDAKVIARLYTTGPGAHSNRNRRLRTG